MDDSKLFIDRGECLDEGSKDIKYFAEMNPQEIIDRWNTPEGMRILERWKESEYSSESLKDIVGMYYGHYDLRGINLSGTDLRGKDLSGIDFFRADLSGANISKANLNDTYLSEADLRGTKFDWAKMEGVLLDSVKYDRNTSFVGVNLNSVNFTLAALLQDLAIGQQRIAHLKERNPVLAFLFRITSDYGRSLSRWALWCMGIIILYACLFLWAFSIPNLKSIWDGIYFSVVTFTTLGYGDIAPTTGGARLFAITEVLLGYIMLGLLVTILSKKILRG